METLFLLLIFVLTTIPPSRQSRATSLYTRETMTAIILALQTPICPYKSKQALLLKLKTAVVDFKNISKRGKPYSAPISHSTDTDRTSASVFNS